MIYFSWERRRCQFENLAYIIRLKTTTRNTSFLKMSSSKNALEAWISSSRLNEKWTPRNGRKETEGNKLDGVEFSIDVNLACNWRSPSSVRRKGQSGVKMTCSRFSTLWDPVHRRRYDDSREYQKSDLANKKWVRDALPISYLSSIADRRQWEFCFRALHSKTKKSPRQ